MRIISSRAKRFRNLGNGELALETSLAVLNHHPMPSDGPTCELFIARMHVRNFHVLSARGTVAFAIRFVGPFLAMLATVQVNACHAL
jgi:hypothetical protein